MGGPLPSISAPSTVTTMVGWPKEPSKGGLSFLAAVHCEWRDEEKDLAAKILIEIRVGYSLKDGHALPDEDLAKHFAHEVAMHHAWPFLRERLRVLSGELGDAVLLPLRPLNSLT